VNDFLANQNSLNVSAGPIGVQNSPHHDTLEPWFARGKLMASLDPLEWVSHDWPSRQTRYVRNVTYAKFAYQYDTDTNDGM